MSQMKKQNKTLVKELNKMKTGNVLGAEFKIMVIRMVINLREEEMNLVRTSTA